jgi:hypothetical protein
MVRGMRGEANIRDGRIKSRFGCRALGSEEAIHLYELREFVRVREPGLSMV